VRTSYGMFLRRHHDAVVSAVQRRVSAWLGVPVDFQEDTQILRYGQGQMYKPHMDSNGRMCTVLIYLTGSPVNFAGTLLGCCILSYLRQVSKLNLKNDAGQELPRSWAGALTSP
jgi:hypothetical protein